jgi:hypothetical protein
LTGRTLQEFCNAQQLLVVTEGGEEGADTVAVTAEKEALFPGLRTWQRERHASCRPYWLWGFYLRDHQTEVKQALTKFRKLVGRVECAKAADKVRALYPMLFNAPCEDQRELAGLVRDVARHGGINSDTVRVEMGAAQKIMNGLEEGGKLPSVEVTSTAVSRCQSVNSLFASTAARFGIVALESDRQVSSTRQSPWGSSRAVMTSWMRRQPMQQLGQDERRSNDGEEDS